MSRFSILLESEFGKKDESLPKCLQASTDATSPGRIDVVFLKQWGTTQIAGWFIMDILINIYGYIWRFLGIGVPLVIIHFNGIFLYKQYIYGYPDSWKPPYTKMDDLGVLSF